MSEERPLRVVIGEDQALLREGVVRLLADAGFEVVAEAGDAPDLCARSAPHKPDVAIVDVQMPPGQHRRRAARGASRSAPTSPASACSCSSQFAEERYALDLIGDSAEGVGYLLKDRVADFAQLRRRRAARRGGRVGARPDGRRPGCSAAAAATTRSSGSRRASARCSS